MQISKSVIVCYYYVIVSQLSKLKSLFINDIADDDRISCPAKFNRFEIIFFRLISNFWFCCEIGIIAMDWINAGYIAILTTEQIVFSLITPLRLPNVFINDVSFSSENMNKFARMAISKSYDSFYLHDTQRVSVDCKLLRS